MNVPPKALTHLGTKPLSQQTVTENPVHGEESRRLSEPPANRPDDVCFECYEQDHRRPRCSYSDRAHGAHYFAMVRENYYALTKGQRDWLHNQDQTPGFAYAEGTAQGVNVRPLSVFGRQANTPYEAPVIRRSQYRQTKN